MGFAWLPYYPVWGVVFIVIAVSVIWALTAHGRDVVEPLLSRTRPGVQGVLEALEQEEQPMTIGPIQAFVIAFPDNDLFEGTHRG